MQVQTSVLAQKAMREAIQDVELVLEEAIEDLQYAWEQDAREQLEQQITVLYALRDAMQQRSKELNYIWN
jgi:acyl-CoA reductase-like NAD-dependent aldehyde dehydrogenase